MPASFARLCQRAGRYAPPSVVGRYNDLSLPLPPPSPMPMPSSIVLPCALLSPKPSSPSLLFDCCVPPDSPPSYCCPSGSAAWHRGCTCRC
jgi:hypothetical protein